MLLLILNLKFDNQAGQIWGRLASVKVRHALRFRKRVAIRIFAWNAHDIEGHMEVYLKSPGRTLSEAGRTALFSRCVIPSGEHLRVRQQIVEHDSQSETGEAISPGASW